MLHINGEIGGGVPLGMFERVPDPQPFTFLGADPSVAGEIRVQKAINAAARATGDSRVGPEGGLITRANFDVAKNVAVFMTHPIRVKLLANTGDVEKTLIFIAKPEFTFAKFEEAVDSLPGDLASVYEFVAKTFSFQKPGLSTGAKIAIGAGALIVLGGGLAFALRPRATIGHTPATRKKVCIKKPASRPARFAIGFAGGAAVGALGEFGLRVLRNRKVTFFDPLGTGGAYPVAAAVGGLIGGVAMALPAPEIPCP